MNKKSLENLIPKNKFDIETAEKLKDYSVEEIKPIIPELLEWLQDMNWPVAKPVAEYFVSFVDDISDEIFEVFQSGDEIWKYWIISTFGAITKSEKIKKEIERIAYHPTKNEQAEEVNEMALEIINLTRGGRKM